MWIWDVDKSTNQYTILPIDIDWWFMDGKVLHNNIEMNKVINNAINSQEPITYNNYTIDIKNKNVKDNSNRIFRLYKNNFYENIINWAKFNSKLYCAIYIWNDSVYTNKHQIIEASYLFKKFNLNNQGKSALYLKDLRSIIKDFNSIPDITLPVGFLEPFDFCGKNDFILPLYFRVDLWRLLIMIHQLTKPIITYSMYSDLDIIPKSYDYLFSDEHIENIAKTGILLDKDCENYFFIMDSNNADVNSKIVENINKIIKESCRYMNKYINESTLINESGR